MESALTWRRLRTPPIHPESGHSRYGEPASSIYWGVACGNLAGSRAATLRWPPGELETDHGSGEDGVDDVVFVDAGEAPVQAIVEVGQAAVVEAHQVQDRGVQVGDMTALFDGGEAQFIRGPHCLAAGRSVCLIMLD